MPSETVRHGYRVLRRGSRYSVFGRAACAEALGQFGRYDALVEIWNGVPWFSPIWCRRPRITFIHHVHGPMWDQILPGPLAACGRAVEAMLAPPFYRRTQVVTPSDATREELLELGFRPARVHAVPNGVSEAFSPGGVRADVPTVIAVGRLAPVKRFDELLRAVVVAQRRVPSLRVEVVGDGPMRGELEQLAATLGIDDRVTFHGQVAHDDLVALYRRAWVVCSASLAEGWGLTLTEAAACGTPAVATDIRGHRSSVVAGETGVLAPLQDLGDALADLLLDDARRGELGAAALRRARTLTWDAAASGILAVLHDVVTTRRRRLGSAG